MFVHGSLKCWNFMVKVTFFFHPLTGQFSAARSPQSFMPFNSLSLKNSVDFITASAGSPWTSLAMSSSRRCNSHVNYLAKLYSRFKTCYRSMREFNPLRTENRTAAVALNSGICGSKLLCTLVRRTMVALFPVLC